MDKPRRTELAGIVTSAQEVAATIDRLRDAALREPRSADRELLYGLEQAAKDAAETVQTATDQVTAAAHQQRWRDNLAAAWPRWQQAQAARRRRTASVAVGILVVIDVLALWLRLT